jgi:hypothetical protein
MADSLLSQAASNPISGLMSLLSPIVTGGAVTPPQGQLLSPDQISQETPAWLAFAQRMAQAGAPTLGPPVTMAQALTGAEGAGYSAEQQARMLPFLVSAAQREQQAGQLALDRQQYEFKREQMLGDVEKSVLGGLGSGGSQAGGAGAAGVGAAPPVASVPGVATPLSPGAPRADLGPAASNSDIASLPDVARLPDQTRVPFIQAAAQIGMPLPAAAQFARMVMQEGQGLHIDPATGKPWVSSAGAIGAAQVEPGTFRDMAQKYGITGAPTDLMPNLLAGGHYFMDQVADHGLHGGVIAYNAGPQGLERYLANGKLPAETADYLVKTGAPGADGMLPSGVAAGAPVPADLAPPTLGPIQVAGPGVPTEPDAPPPASINLRTGQGEPAANLVQDPLSHAMVPQPILQAARAAILTPGPPGTGIAAYNKVISDYLATVASKGRMVTVPPEELQRLGYDPRIQMTATMLPDGTMTDLKPAGGRNPLQQIEQETNLRNEYLNDPAVAPYRAAKAIVGRMQGTLAAGQTRELQQPDDMSLIKNFARMNDPNAVVKAGDMEDVMNGAGIPGDIKQGYARVVGGGVLTDQQRQWLINTARAELGGMAAGAMSVLLEKRDIAKGNGLRPDMIGIPEVLSNEANMTLRATPPDAARPGMPTAPPGNSLTIPRPGIQMPSGALPSGTALAGPLPAAAPAAAPVAAPPAAGAAAVPDTGPPATVDRFTPEQWAQMSKAGLDNATNDLARNPGHYSLADRRRLSDAMAKFAK